MTNATDHKNNLNRSVLKKDYARTLRVETIANSAGGTAQVAIVAQLSIGFLNAKYYSNGSPRKTQRTALAASLSDSPAQNPNRIGLPARHDGGSWAWRKLSRLLHMASKAFEEEKRHGIGLTSTPTQNRKPCTDKQMVFERATLMGIPSSRNRQPIHDHHTN